MTIKPAGWPAPGPQADGSYIEYLYPQRGNQIKSWRRHASYLDFILNGRGNNKGRLIARIFLATGGNPADTDGFLAFQVSHSGRKWTFAELHRVYDQHLAPEHRSWRSDQTAA